MSYHYKAFISYKHDPVDSEIASEIQTRLERFHIPRALQKEKGIRNLRPVFRDKEELSATDDLNDTIKNALMETEYLIVICSTRSIKSIWVQKEIEFFLSHHDKSKVLTVLVDGEPDKVIPSVLYEKETITVDENGNEVTVIEPLEPLSCDYRMERRRARREEFPRLAAALIGCRYNDLRQRQRQYQMRLMGAGLLASSLLMLYFIWSNIQISANLKQSQISRSRNLANLSTSYLDENDRMMAVKLALEALPDENNSRPVIHEAAYALSKAEGAYNYPDTLDIEEVAQLPARHKLNAFKVSLDGRYLAMLDGYYLIRFFDLETMEEIGQAELAKAASLLWMTETDVLFVSCGDLLSAFNIRTGELLWKETYENNILAMCVSQDTGNGSPVIALVFEDYVLAVNSDDRRILGRFDSESEESVFHYQTDHPYTYVKFPCVNEYGHSLYLDEEKNRLYVLSRDDSSGVSGLLALDFGTLTSSYHPMKIECSGQYSMTADDTGICLLCEKADGDFPLNTFVTNSDRRTDWVLTITGNATVLRTDFEGNILWETKLPFDGTTMLGYTELVQFPETEFKSGAKAERVLGALFSNQVCYLDMSDGTLLGTASLISEICDTSVSSNSIFVFTVDGYDSIISPSDTTVASYKVFKDSVAGGRIRNPEFSDKRITVYLHYPDGVRIYSANRGDPEYTAYPASVPGNSMHYGSLSGSRYFVCTGSQKIAVLDSEAGNVEIRSIEDFGMTAKKGLAYMDPEETFVLVYGKNSEGDVFKKISLEDLSAEDLVGPGMRKDDALYSYNSSPACAGQKIVYFTVKSYAGLPKPFCLCIYDIPSDSWTIHELDFDMLNLLLAPSVSKDASTILVADEWANGYLIRTEDGTYKALPDKIPAWKFTCWNEKGTAFALCKSDTEKEQIEVYDTEGKKLFSQGRDFVQPLSMTFHGRRLYVLYEDYLVCEYDSASGELLRTISAKTSFSPTKSQHRWDFTDDGQLILTMGNVIAQIDLKLGGMIAEVRSDAGYMPASDRFFVVNGQYSETDPNAFFSYNRYTVDDMIRKGKELVGDMELTEAQRRSFALD